MEIKTFHASSVSISAVLMKAMGKKVLRKCRDSVTMATIYVVMPGKNVYEYSRVYVLNLQGIVNIRCHLETFQAWSKNFGDSPRSIFWPVKYRLCLCTSMNYLSVGRKPWYFSSPEPKAHRWVYSIGRHPSSVRRRRQHFQTTSALKPWSRFLSNFIYNIYRPGERKDVFFVPIG